MDVFDRQVMLVDESFYRWVDLVRSRCDNCKPEALLVECMKGVFDIRKECIILVHVFLGACKGCHLGVLLLVQGACVF